MFFSRKFQLKLFTISPNSKKLKEKVKAWLAYLSASNEFKNPARREGQPPKVLISTISLTHFQSLW